jgi:hypothetical protein
LDAVNQLQITLRPARRYERISRWSATMLLERKGAPLLTRRAFLQRFARYVLLALAMLIVALALGMLGYHAFLQLSWIDSFLNAAMILGGMGPIDAPKTDVGKLFAGCYALFSGLVFITVSGILFAPLAHRLLHWFHADPPPDDGDAPQ